MATGLNHPNEITVPAILEETLMSRRDALAKRCQKLGVPAPQVTVTRRFMLSFTNEAGVQSSRPWIAYTVTGEKPALPGGWQIVASIEHHATGNIVSVAPAFQADAPKGLFRAPATCDHCGHNRRRAKTVIVRDANGAESRVGLNCLRDFTGHDLPAVWSLPDLTFWDDETLGSVADRRFLAQEVIAQAFAVVRVAGWTKSRSEDDPDYVVPTHKRVSDALRGHQNCGKHCDACDYPVTAADREATEDALAWILATTDEEGYIANLRAAIVADATTTKHALICSLVAAWHHKLNAEKRAEAKRDAEPAVKTDCPEGRVTITGVIIKDEIKENDWGTRRVMTVRDDAGFCVWGSYPTFEGYAWPSVNDRVTFTATVERSDRDASFGFYKRPTKAKVTEWATAGSGK